MTTPDTDPLVDPERRWFAAKEPVFPHTIRWPLGPAEQITGLWLIHEAAHAIVACSYGRHPAHIWLVSSSAGAAPKACMRLNNPAAPSVGEALAVIAWSGWVAMWQYWDDCGLTRDGNIVSFARECQADFRQARTALRGLGGDLRVHRDHALLEAQTRVTHAWTDILDLAQFLGDHQGRLPGNDHDDTVPPCCHSIARSAACAATDRSMIRAESPKRS
jgi:hypothetical protein